MSGILKSEYINRVANGQHVVQPVKWWSNLGHTCQNVLLVKLTPELAEQLWNRNRVNRKFKERIATRYAKEMKEGRWKLNGETIIFDTEGRCVQGQHRLYAVMKSQSTIWVYMVFDVDPAAFMTMDSGARRSAADQLGIMGHVNTTNLASAAALLHRYQTHRVCSNDILPNTLCIDVVERCPGIVDSVQATNKLHIRKAKPSVVAVTHYVTNQISPIESTEFIGKFESGVGLAEGDPELTLIRKLEGLRGSAIKRNNTLPFVELYCFVVAWNARREGKQLAMIRFPKEFNSDSFPEFI